MSNIIYNLNSLEEFEINTENEKKFLKTLMDSLPKGKSWKDILYRYLDMHGKGFSIEGGSCSNGEKGIYINREMLSDTTHEIVFTRINLYLEKDYSIYDRYHEPRIWHILDFRGNTYEHAYMHALNFLCNENREYYDMDKVVLGNN